MQIEKPDVTEVNNKNTSNISEPSFYIQNYQMHTKNLEKGHRGFIVYTINSLMNINQITAASSLSENLMLSIDAGRHEQLLLTLYTAVKVEQVKTMNI